MLVRFRALFTKLDNDVDDWNLRLLGDPGGLVGEDIGEHLGENAACTEKNRDIQLLKCNEVRLMQREYICVARL